MLHRLPQPRSLWMELAKAGSRHLEPLKARSRRLLLKARAQRLDREHLLELLTVRNAALLIACVGLASLASAWTFQAFGFEPCELCYAERVPYYFAVPAGYLAVFIADRAPKAAALILAAICAAMVYDAVLSAYHAGVEWHFWAGPDACTGNGAGVQASGSLSQRLRHNTAVRCDVAAIRIFGISLAGYLVFLSLGLAGAGAAALYRARRTGTL